MFKTEAKTPEEYIASLSEDRAGAISRVRHVILDNLPEGYEETIRWGMISYEVPLSVHSDTYNGEPLSYVALAFQKHHMALYMMQVYGNPKLEEWFVKKYKETGKKLDMGKSCVRFKKIDDLPLDLIAETVSVVPMEEFVKYYEEMRSKRKRQSKG